MSAASLVVPVTVTANATGKVRAQVAVPNGQVWRITGITVQATGPLAPPATNPMPEARIYYMDDTPGRLLGGTYTGALDTSGGPDFDLHEGELLVVVWTIPDPADYAAFAGATCTATFSGTVTQ